MIYFMQPADGGPIKIGFSDNVPARLKQLESAYGLPLALLATMPGDLTVEAETHERFAHLRLGRTEQFQPAAELLTFIGRPILVSPNPDSVTVLDCSTVNVVSMRGKLEWREWLRELSVHCRATPSGLIDRALAELARREGFKPPPPRL